MLEGVPVKFFLDLSERIQFNNEAIAEFTMRVDLKNSPIVHFPFDENLKRLAVEQFENRFV